VTTTARSFFERELTEPVRLVGSDGRFNAAAHGWSRHPVHTCNVYEPLERRKKWNYWAVTDENFLFSATIADMERAWTGGAYLFDRRTRLHINKGIRRAPWEGQMPEGISGDIVLDHPDMKITMRDAGAGTRIRVSAADFAGRPLAADILVERPAGHETLNVVIPWNDLETQFTSKQNTLPASGYVLWGDERFELTQPAFGCLDYGRGVWPEHTVWNWGAASGVQRGRTVGINLGDKWTTGTGATENGLCVDGRLTKVSEDLMLEYDREHWMRPWRIRTPVTDRMDLLFTPEYDRHEQTGRRDKYFTEVHQLFGTYSGAIRPDGEGLIEIEGLFGWIEEHEARW
jgi:hypothetical protein